MTYETQETAHAAPSTPSGATPRFGEPEDWNDPQEPILYVAPQAQMADAWANVNGASSEDEPSDEAGAAPADAEELTALTLEEIAARCVAAKAQGVPWEPILYVASPDAQTVDRVLTLLAGRPGFAGKQPLKTDYKQYAAEQDACAREAADQVRICKLSANRLALLYDPTHLNDMVKQVEEALCSRPGEWEVLLHNKTPSYIAANPTPYLYQSGGSGAKSPSIPSLEPHTTESLLLRIEQSVFFYSKGKKGIEPIPVPKDLVRHLLKKPGSNLPVTIGLVPHPLVLPNGELLIEEGLHAESGIYAHFGGATFEAPSDLTPQEGVEILRTEMFGEFEFASEADEAAALALVLTAIQRKTLDIAPGFLINASTQGSGKTTLARMAHLLITGQEMLPATMTENLEEQRKELTAVLTESAPIVCFDNVPDGLEVVSSTLAKALTSAKHTGRILGHTRMAKLSTNAVFLMTGNNITVSLELSRRVLEVRLAPKEERPEQRRFDHPDVQSYVLRNRTRWMQAGLAILSGSRDPQANARPSGFEQWDRMVRWTLVNADVADPVSKFDAMRENAPEHDSKTAWMLGLVHGYRLDTQFRAQDLVRQGGAEPDAVAKASLEEMPQRQEMYADYLDGHPPAKGWGNVKSVGKMLGGLVERNVGGYKLTRKTVRGTTYYSITEV